MERNSQLRDKVYYAHRISKGTKMAIYYTVHGEDEFPKWDDGRPVGSIADDFGFEKRLGFRPRWCSGLYEDSLADSWFSIWSASPLFVEVMSFIESDAAVPIDALAWTQIRQRYMGSSAGQPGWLDEFEQVFDVEGVPRYRLEYLVPDSPKTTRSLPAEILTTGLSSGGAQIISKLTGLGDAGAAKMQRFFEHIMTDAKGFAEAAGLKWPLGLENGYRCIVQTSGIPALLWMIGTKSPIDTCLLDIACNDFGDRAGCTYDKAQIIRQRWDEEPSSITDEDFEELYRLFRESISEAAERSAARMAQGTGRNEPCPCHSGLKYKKCHGAHHDIEWYAHRTS